MTERDENGGAGNGDKTTRVGRPRAARHAPLGPVREEILGAARRLFRERGFTATSTREIARAAGLRQPSLFHYFPSKEAILKEVALGAVEPVLEFIRDERARRQAADVAFYRLVRFDTHHLCTDDNALAAPFLFPELKRPHMAEFWQRRDDIVAHYGELLRRGTRSGAFVMEDHATVTHLLFALGESTLQLDPTARRQQAARLAAVTAGVALRAVLKDPLRLREIREVAGPLDA